MHVQASWKLALALALILLMLGCDRTTVQTVETVDCANGTDRLIRNAWVTISYTRLENKSYNSYSHSHSLVWQRLESGRWTDHVTITQDDFQRGNPQRRWVSSIHSFDPDSGTATLQIAEGNAPANSARVSYAYSWREWDIRNNREIKLLRMCKDPFEPFEIPENKQ